MRKLATLTVSAALLTGAATLLGWTANAQAMVILQQDPIASGGGVQSSSSFRSFDDFSLPEAAMITTVRWWEASSVERSLDFTISFFEGSVGFFPDLASSIYAATVTATGTQVDSFLNEYEAALPTAVLLPGNTDLWLSVVSTSGSFFWGRASNAPSTGRLPAGISVSQRTNGSFLLQGLDTAWALEAGAATVPEPGTLAILGLGLALLARRRARAEPRPAPPQRQLSAAPPGSPRWPDLRRPSKVSSTSAPRSGPRAARIPR